MLSGGCIPEAWLPRCSRLLRLGLVANLVLACFMLLYYFELLGPRGSHGAEPAAPGVAQDEHSEKPDLSSLNVRLSTRPIHPPDDVIKRTVPLPGLRPTRPMFGEPTRAAILEDDARRRVLILSAAGERSPGSSIQVYLLYEFELERYLPRTMACAGNRRCAQDRTPGTGGLACVAVCLVEALRQ